MKIKIKKHQLDKNVKFKKNQVQLTLTFSYVDFSLSEYLFITLQLF
jgi:hypothetical protein